MTEPREPTLKQWKRRALQAEQQVEFLQEVRELDAAIDAARSQAKEGAPQ